VVIAGNSDPIFKRLMHVVGRPDLADDPALARNDGRVAQVAMLDAAITAWTTHHCTDDVVAALEAAEVPAGRIYSVADIVADPHYQARGMLLDAALPGGKSVKMPGIVPKLSDTPGEILWQGPTLGEHTDSVLSDLGFAPADVERLHKNGAVQ
jgi:crotonobetainyl-CoA:carnitine CoA-transferase CaiB-like acyl-CoA transferase